MSRDWTPHELYLANKHYNFQDQTFYLINNDGTKTPIGSSKEEREKYPYLSFYGEYILDVAKEKGISDKDLSLFEKTIGIIVKSEDIGISSRMYDDETENKMLQIAAKWFRGDYDRYSSYENAYYFVENTSTLLGSLFIGERKELESSMKQKVWTKHATGTDTGYKDKNGNPIYIGDIVREACNGIVSEVVWNPYRASYWLNGCGEGYGIEDSDVEWEIVQPVSEIGWTHPDTDFDEIDYE